VRKRWRENAHTRKQSRHLETLFFFQRTAVVKALAVWFSIKSLATSHMVVLLQNTQVLGEFDMVKGERHCSSAKPRVIVLKIKETAFQTS
jgi:hypothetical protein